MTLRDSPYGGMSKTATIAVVESGSNNIKGTGPASVFEFLTEPLFLCLRTAAEKNSFEDQVLQAAHGSENFATFLLVIFKFIS